MRLDANTSPLAPHLLDLLNALANQDVPLMLIGGFGLLLRLEHIQQTNQNTLLTRIPPARATEDFDVMLHLELYADMGKMELLTVALKNLGYLPIEKREFYQFRKILNDGNTVKVDLLAPLPDEEDTRFKVDGQRVKLKDSTEKRKGSPPVILPKIHAHRTPEAIAVHDMPLRLTLEGLNSNQQQCQGSIDIPHPYAFILLKLYAFNDQHENKKQLVDNEHIGYAQKHAGDIYTLFASLLEKEDQQLLTFVEKYADSPIAIHASSVVKQHFSDPTSIGILRIQEQFGKLEPNEIEVFVEAITRAFPEVNPESAKN